MYEPNWIICMACSPVALQRRILHSCAAAFSLPEYIFLSSVIVGKQHIFFKQFQARHVLPLLWNYSDSEVWVQISGQTCETSETFPTLPSSSKRYDLPFFFPSHIQVNIASRTQPFSLISSLLSLPKLCARRLCWRSAMQRLPWQSPF